MGFKSFEESNAYVEKCFLDRHRFINDVQAIISSVLKIPSNGDTFVLSETGLGSDTLSIDSWKTMEYHAPELKERIEEHFGAPSEVSIKAEVCTESSEPSKETLGGKLTILVKAKGHTNMLTWGGIEYTIKVKFYSPEIYSASYSSFVLPSESEELKDINMSLDPYLTITHAGKGELSFEHRLAVAALIKSDVLEVFPRKESGFVIAVCMSDEFILCCSLYENVEHSELQTLYNCYIIDPTNGPVVWAAKKLGMTPQRLAGIKEAGVWDEQSFKPDEKDEGNEHG